MRIYLIIATLFISFFARAEAPKVPSVLYLGDMVLKITPGAQKKIQSHVNSYRKSPTYFQRKVDLANLYFPIIEKEFKKEKVPDDFKYLIIQESGFVSDAVSSSNAVGFWQFKAATGKEVGLIINSKVDERKNISKSSKGAAKYFKSNNFYFNNWVYALQAYNQGAGGTQKDSDKKYYGKKKMDITAKTHWYVLKFLAHKIAYEGAVGGESGLGFYLKEYATKGVSLKEIANKNKLDFNRLKDYNKWLSVSKIPSDREYTVLLTIDGKKGPEVATNEEEDNEGGSTIVKNAGIDFENNEVNVETADNLPNISIKINQKSIEQKEYLKKHPHIFARINGLNTIKSKRGDTKDKLALAGGISTKKFLKYNDIKSFDKILPHKFYYLQNKRSRAKAHYHTVRWNESLWEIAQDYGIHISAIEKKNRLSRYHELRAGRVLHLYKPRGKDELVRFEDPGPNPKEKKKKETKKENKLNPKKERKKEENKKDVVIAKVEESKLEEIPDISVEEEVRKDWEGAGGITKKKDEGSENESEEEKNIVPTKEVEEYPIYTEEDGVLFHTVQEGETLYGISVKYKVSVEQIMKWNRMSEPVISVDQMLVVGLKETVIEDEGVEPEVENNENRSIHVVKKGETLYGISRKYSVSVEQIMEWNNMNEPVISVGQKLIVGANGPIKENTSEAKPKTSNNEIIHTVSLGETLYSISRKYNVPVDKILEWNNKSDNSLSEGEQLKIKQ